MWIENLVDPILYYIGNEKKEKDQSLHSLYQIYLYISIKFLYINDFLIV